MITNQINIGQNFNKLSFMANEGHAVANAPVATASKDSFVASNKIEPPVISDTELYGHKITDAQIDQINKAGMLPPNARFEKLYAYGGRGGMLTEPIYDIVPYFPLFKFVPKINEHTRKLPDGYQVAKITKGRLNGFIGAVPIQKK